MREADDETDVTKLLSAVNRGAPDAVRQLYDLVHGELQQLAAHKMRDERPGHTLQPTALVNEAYLRLFNNQSSLEDRKHFFGAAARAMERVLVDHARQRGAKKRGGDGAAGMRITLAGVASNEPQSDGSAGPANIPAPDTEFDIFEIHDSIEALELESAEMAALVRYRYFVGLTLEQTAEVQGMSLATAKRRWTFARAWLFDRLGH
ncbi:MAG: ECF-type sigma factor [Planctomycetota bacterium]